MLAAVQQTGYALRFTSASLRDDDAFMRSVVEAKQPSMRQFLERAGAQVQSRLSLLAGELLALVWDHYARARAADALHTLCGE